MDKYTFPLKNPIVIPAFGIPNKGLLYYKPNVFGLSYTITPNPKESILNVKIQLVDLLDNTVVTNLREVNITKKGFPTGVILNSEEIKKYQEQYNSIKAELITLEEQIVLLNMVEDKQDEVIIELAEANVQYENKWKELQAMGTEPQPIELFISKYDEVINYFEKDGSINEQGLTWAYALPFLGKTIGYYI